MSWSGYWRHVDRAVTVAPSAALWYQADATSLRIGAVVVAAGPDLPAAPAEATAVASLHP